MSCCQPTCDRDAVEQVRIMMDRQFVDADFIRLAMDLKMMGNDVRTAYDGE